MKTIIRKYFVVIAILLGFTFQACQNENPVVEEPNPQSEQVLTNEQTAEIVAKEISKTGQNYGTAAIVNDLTIIATTDPNGAATKGDLIGMLQTDSTISYEGDTYSTTLTYEISYKVGNQIVDDFSPLADTAFVSYTIESTLDNIQFYGSRNAESTSFVIAGIRMPTTEININMNTIFDMSILMKIYPNMNIYLNGTTSFEDIIVSLTDATIQSGVGTLEFVISTENVSSDTIIASVEFVENGQAIITINGEQYVVNIDTGALVP